MPVEWIPRLTNMGSSDSVEVRSLEVHDLRPLFKAIFTDSSLNYGYLCLSIDQSSSHLRFLTRNIALGEGNEEFIVGDSSSLAFRSLSLV
nr:hypothetical protein Iba_chr11aCG11910 [Ipomoea batatas]